MWKRIRKPLIILASVLFIALVAIQLVPVDRSNPPITMEVDAPAAALAVLEQSCYDCHSNETRWPWYSYLAPVSWLVAKDVHEGREHMNFSTWDRYSPDNRAHLIEEMLEETTEGAMPLPIYLTMHKSAKLTEADFEALRAWSATAAAPTGASEADHDNHDH